MLPLNISKVILTFVIIGIHHAWEQAQTLWLHRKKGGVHCHVWLKVIRNGEGTSSTKFLLFLFYIVPSPFLQLFWKKLPTNFSSGIPSPAMGSFFSPLRPPFDCQHTLTTIDRLPLIIPPSTNRMTFPPTIWPSPPRSELIAWPPATNVNTSAPPATTTTGTLQLGGKGGSAVEQWAQTTKIRAQIITL